MLARPASGNGQQHEQHITLPTKAGQAPPSNTGSAQPALTLACMQAGRQALPLGELLAERGGSLKLGWCRPWAQAGAGTPQGFLLLLFFALGLGARGHLPGLEQAVLSRPGHSPPSVPEPPRRGGLAVQGRCSPGPCCLGDRTVAQLTACRSRFASTDGCKAVRMQLRTHAGSADAVRSSWHQSAACRA